MLHSLVRVSRRVGCGHSGTNDCSARCDRPPSRRAPTVGRPLQAVTTAAAHRAGAAQPPPGGGGLRCWCEKISQALLSRVPERQTSGCKFPTRTRGHLPTTPSWAGSNCRWPAPRRSADRSADAGRPARSNRAAAGPGRPLLSLTGSHFSRIRFPPNGFAVFLTLFSKYFSPFPHGTCSLSVSCQYLALDGVYHPLWAAFPNNPTLRRQSLPGPAVSRTGLSPSPTCLSRSTSTAPARAQAASPGHNSPAQSAGDSRLELIPLRSPLLGESLLVSLPPLINMLKFSG